MGFTLHTATRLAVQFLLATTTVTSITASPLVDVQPSPYEDGPEEVIDVSDYSQHHKLPHYTQEEYLSLCGGNDPTHVVDEHELKGRQSTAYTPVTGVTLGCVNRQKIEVWQADNAAEWNLFMLACANIQAISETDPLSWYMIMGIHGLPHIPWGQPQQGNYDFDLGYCPHSSAIFGTWHRPYLLLMEQWIQEKARRIALQFSGSAQTTYTKASPNVRLPYWDWSSPDTQSNLPPVITQTTVKVIKPVPGKTTPATVTIANPLYQYVFKSKTLQQQYFSGNFAVWNSTRRQPDANGNSQNSVANSVMQSDYQSRRQQTYNVISSSQTYLDFTNTCEGIHNEVHVNIGGDNGHMSFLDYSAFDPIFFLHHTNVDRLFAMWEAVHPGKHLTPTTATATFGRNIDPSTCGCSDNSGTALFPFHVSNGQWWKSSFIQDAPQIWQYGFGYPEVPCSYRGQSTSSLQSFTTTQVNQLYGPNTQTGMSTTSTPGTQSAQSDDPAAQEKERDEWGLKFFVNNCDIPGSWTLYVFLGSIPTDVSTWATAPNKLGSICGLGNPVGSTGMKSCRMAPKNLPLSWKLIDAGFVQNNQDYSKIPSYLAAKLNYALSTNGQQYDMSQLNAKIAVAKTRVTYPAPNNPSALPTYGKPVYDPTITKGKPCGINSLNDLSGLVDTTTPSDGLKLFLA